MKLSILVYIINHPFLERIFRRFKWFRSAVINEAARVRRQYNLRDEVQS